jgi:hypothetical protein
MLRDDSINRLKNNDSMRGLVANDSLIIKRNDIIENDYDENDKMFPLTGLESDDIYMLDRKASVKKGFFSMIDNVLGGAQSKNISMISNTYSQYNQITPNTVKPVSPGLTINITDMDKFGGCGDISPTIIKQQKIYDTNTTMVSSNYVNSFNYGHHTDSSLFAEK